MFFYNSPKRPPIIWLSFVMKMCHQELSKIIQTGHTVKGVLEYGRASVCESERECNDQVCCLVGISGILGKVDVAEKTEKAGTKGFFIVNWPFPSAEIKTFFLSFFLPNFETKTTFLQSEP